MPVEAVRRLIVVLEDELAPRKNLEKSSPSAAPPAYGPSSTAWNSAWNGSSSVTQLAVEVGRVHLSVHGVTRKALRRIDREPQDRLSLDGRGSEDPDQQCNRREPIEQSPCEHDSSPLVVSGERTASSQRFSVTVPDRLPRRCMPDFPSTRAWKPRKPLFVNGNGRRLMPTASGRRKCSRSAGSRWPPGHEVA